jgi:teichuronic acid biosynthesis glycosyltransferase TuaH
MKKILYLSLVDWFWIKQRPHHICEGLSKNHKVIYFNRRSFIKDSRLYNSHQNKNLKYYSNSFKINDNLQVIRKKIIPFQGRIKIIKEINNLLIKKQLEKLDKEHRFDTIIITNPNDIEVLSDRFINNKSLIYDCMDNYKKFPGSDEGKIRNNEIKLLNLCNKVIVSSDDLYDELMKYNLEIMSKTKVVNNGVDIEKFNIKNYGKHDVANIFHNDNKKKICYIGTISDWVDLDLVSEVAKKYNVINFYFVGPIDKTIDIEKYENCVNLKFLGVQPYDSIPKILNSIDIAMMPFKLNDLVMSVNPVKIYEYLAMGKPVIATRYTETEKFGDLINLYNTIGDFEKTMLGLLNEDNTALQQKRIDFANKNSWESRVMGFVE